MKLPEIFHQDNVEDGCLGHSDGEVVWNVTYACNLQCRHCYLPSSHREGELSLEEGLEVVDETRRTFGSTSQIVFSGGEPLLRNDIYKLVEYASSSGLRVALATNGTLLSRKVAERLREAGVDEVAISLDGAFERTHERIRGVEGAFNAALRGALNVREAGVSLQLHFTLMRDNASELPYMIELAERLEARRLFIFDLMPTGRASYLKHHGLDTLNLFDYLFKEQRRFKVWLKPQGYPYFWVYLLSKAEDLKVDLDIVKKYFKGCLASRSMLRVSPEGKVSPCPFLPLFVGNVREAKLSHLWLTSDMLKEVRCRVMLKGSCGSCEFKSVCGGCRAKAYALSNDHLAEDPSCPFT